MASLRGGWGVRSVWIVVLVWSEGRPLRSRVILMDMRTLMDMENRCSRKPWVSQVTFLYVLYGQLLSGTGGLIPDISRFLGMKTTSSEDSRVRVRASSDIPDLTNNFDETTQMPSFGSGVYSDIPDVKRPYLAPVAQFPGIFGCCTETPRRQDIPEFEIKYLGKNRILQATRMGSPDGS